MLDKPQYNYCYQHGSKEVMAAFRRLRGLFDRAYHNTASLIIRRAKVMLTLFTYSHVYRPADHCRTALYLTGQITLGGVTRVAGA